MNRTIKIFNNTDELSLFFAEYLMNLVRKKSKHQNFSLVLSGGSTPKAVFKYLSMNYKDKIDWSKVLIFWGDERCVPPESDESNYKMAKESFLDSVSIQGSNIFRIKGENEPNTEAIAYSEIVKKNVQLVGGLPKFDLMMLGLGDDGHTASIFPGQLQLFDNELLYASTENPYSKQKRITATGNIINHAENVFFLVKGENKAEMLSRLIEKKQGWDKLPASFVNPLSGIVFWLIDEEAASDLSM